MVAFGNVLRQVVIIYCNCLRNVAGSCSDRQLFIPTERMVWVTVCVGGSFLRMVVI